MVRPKWVDEETNGLKTGEEVVPLMKKLGRVVLRPLDWVQISIQHLVTAWSWANDYIPVSSIEKYWPLPPHPVDLKITQNDACECALKTTKADHFTLMNFNIIAGSAQNKNVGPFVQNYFKIPTAEKQTKHGPFWVRGPTCDCTGRTPMQLTLDNCLTD